MYGQGILIDVAAKWSKDPKICAAVTSRIEVAISRGHDAITYTDDCGERIVIVGEIRK